MMRERGEGSESAKLPCGYKSWSTPAILFMLAMFFLSSTVVYSYLRVHDFSSFTSGGSKFDGAFFIFGDSYADVGNLPSGASRDWPYGETWPGSPAGRYSDGRLQSDAIAAQVFGRPCPPAFGESTASTLSRGANFAVAGAGLTYAYGSPNISTQVGWFEALVDTGIYTKKTLASSVTLLCIAGNDYGSYKGPLQNYLAFAKEVVGLMEQSLRTLYSLGLRNIMVTTVAPLNCLPVMTVVTGFTTCSKNATVDDLVYNHNLFLEETLVTLSNNLSGSNFILLRQGEALRHIQTNTMLFNISQPFKPCCFGLCSVSDSSGNLLYTLCPNPENYVIWDNVHPTHAAWENVVSLYAKDERFTKFAPTLQHWAENLSRNTGTRSETVSG